MSQEKGVIYNEIRQEIPTPKDETQLNELVLSFGFSLLQEITFSLIVYCNEDVQSADLREAIIREYTHILDSLIHSQTQYDQIVQLKSKVTDEMLYSYMNLKRKRMNFSMMVLADCISFEGALPPDLLDYVQKMGEIFEIRAVAYKDLQSANKINNLYNFWHIWQKGEEDMAPPEQGSVAMRAQFYQFIEEHCRELMERYKLREYQYFDERLYAETMQIIDNYYKLDPKISLMTKRN